MNPIEKIHSKDLEPTEKDRLKELLEGKMEITDHEKEELRVVILELESKIRRIENDKAKDFESFEDTQRILSAIVALISGVSALVTKSPALVPLTLLGSSGVASAKGVNTLLTKFSRWSRTSKIKSLIDVINENI
jgi:hypothetical protein